MVEYIVRKGENADYHHFSFPTMFSKDYVLGAAKSRHRQVKG